MFPNAIKRIRSALELTQQELADYIGVSQPSIVRYEKDHFRPNLLVAKQLLKLAKHAKLKMELIDFYPD